MVACTAMAILKEEESKEDGNSTDTSWEKWKRGGIIGAAALTGGTLMAITGGVFFSLFIVLLMMVENMISYILEFYMLGGYTEFRVCFYH